MSDCSKQKWFPSLLLVAVLLTASACTQRSYQEPQMGRDFGASLESMQLSQRANPDAPVDNDPVVGMDGRAAAIALESYRKTFDREKQEPPPAIFSLGKK